MDGLVKNYDHKSFKKPPPEYEKRESSHTNKKNHDAKINYTSIDATNVIKMVELVEHLYMMSPKFEKEPNYDTDDERPKVFLKIHNAQQNHRDTRPKVVLRVAELSSLHGETLNTITRRKAKVILKVSNDPKNASSFKKVATLSISIYDLVSQLQRTHAQILIFELLEISPLHKEILEKALCTSNFPMNTDTK